MMFRIASSACAKLATLCAHLRWVARPEEVSVGPYHEFPMSIPQLRLLFHTGRALIHCHLSNAGRSLQGHGCQNMYVCMMRSLLAQPLMWHMQQKPPFALRLAVCTVAQT